MNADREAAIREWAENDGVFQAEDGPVIRFPEPEDIRWLLAELAAAREREQEREQWWAEKHRSEQQAAMRMVDKARERERLLREALRQIRDYEWHPGQPPAPDVRAIARAALDVAGEQT